MTDIFPLPGCRVEAVTPDGPDLLHVDARGTRPGGCCPDCGRPCRAVHSRYRRRPADLPSIGRRVQVGLRVRRFYCRNAKCARRTFAERLPELVAPHARRTGRLAKAQGRAGAALGGQSGAKLLLHLAMPTSADTVLRLIRRLPLPEVEVPRVVAVDDWALCKGRTYGTIVVDLERRRVADLLPDRTSPTVAEWLRQRPGVEVVARDRSTQYARAAVIGAPKAVPCTRFAGAPSGGSAQGRWSPAAGTCWPTCARRSSAGCTPPTPGSGACRLRQPMPRLRRSRPAATRHSGIPALSGRPGPRAARAGRRATRRSGTGTERVSRCWQSHAPWVWRARPCGRSPRPRASQPASRAARVRALLILFCPTWNGGWPKGVRTALFCGASYAAWAFRAGASRSTAGWLSGGRCRPGSGGRGRRTQATDKRLWQARKGRPCQRRGNSRGCWSSPSRA